VKYAARAEDGIREMNTQRDNSGKAWGRFANRTGGPKPYRPSNGEGRPDAGSKDHVRANAVTPQLMSGPLRPNNHGRHQRQQGRRLSRAKRDELRAEGKYFQCERTGHSQRDCPALNTMRPPVVSAGSVNIARLERLAETRDRADLQVGYLALGAETDCDDDTTPAMRRAYELCAETWGKDDGWLDVKSRADSRYGIYQYNTGPGELIEVTDREQTGFGVMEIDVARFDDPDFRLVDMFHTGANTDRSCVREGGFRDQQNYKIWEWPAIAWLRELIVVAPCRQLRRLAR